MIGQTHLHYRIVEKIGEGGLGVVYKAVDTHLDRPVAVKILPPDKVADPERKRRFVLEAKAASALHHPNIVVIHDIASDQGVDFIVMEYVDGPSLDHLIGRRGMKLASALALAVQIADGLSKAHAAGIVHRDLKPTNVMVTPGGLVKILDFGLAKLTEPALTAAGPQTMTLAQAEKPRTEEGFVVGTAAYMSPEQAEGGTVDARSDIFAFGVLLYEMLTGQRAFQRESRMKTLAAVLGEEPKPASELNEALPAEIERLLVRCLRKDPARRWQTASDLRVALQDLKEESESGKLPAASAQRGRGRRRPGIFWAAAAGGVILLLAAVIFVLLPRMRKPAPAPAYATTRLTYDAGFTAMPARSPDGKMVAYVSDREGDGNLELWVQQVSGGKPLRLTNTPCNEHSPSFSADGTKIAYCADGAGGGIFVIDALGGEPRKIVDASGLGLRFSPDGTRLAFVSLPASLDTRLFNLYVVPAQGGAPMPVHPEFLTSYLSQGATPIWSPDGKAILISAALHADPASSSDWWVIPVDGAEPVRTRALANLGQSPAVEYPALWIGTSVYYVYGTTIEGVNIFRAAIDPKTYAITGPPVAVTSGQGMKIMLSDARDGRFAYAQTNVSLDVWGVSARADQGIVGADFHKLTADVMQKFYPAVSRDGKRLVFTAFGGLQGARLELRRRDLDTGRETVFPLRVQGMQFGQLPRFGPDGILFAYRDFIEGAWRTLLVPTGATTGADVGAIGQLVDFFPDPSFALVDTPAGLVKRSLKTGENTPVLKLSADALGNASLSADGRWAAVQRGFPDGRVAIEAVPIGAAPAEEKDLVTLAASDRYLGNPRWSPDGRTVYYLSEESGRCGLYARTFDPRAGKPGAPARAVFFSSRERFSLNYPRAFGFIDVAADKIIFAVDEITANIFLVTPIAR